MKKYSLIMLALLLILTAAVPASLVGAQNNSNFNKIIQKISSSENLNSQEKADVIDKAIELHYEREVSIDQISEVLNQSNNYNDIENQFTSLDVNKDDENDKDDDHDRDDDEEDDD